MLLSLLPALATEPNPPAPPRHIVVVLGARGDEIAERRATGLAFDGHRPFPAISERLALVTASTPNKGLARDGTIDHKGPTLIEALRDAGWTTGHFGIWGFTGHSGGGVPVLPDDVLRPGSEGFSDWMSATADFGSDPWMGSPDGATHLQGSAGVATVEAALSFLEGNRKRRSFSTLWLPSDAAGALGALDAGIARLGLADDTLIWTLGDHAGDGLVRWQGHLEVGVNSAPVSVLDVVSTVAELADLPATAGASGRSITPCFLAAGAPLPPPVVSTTPRAPPAPVDVLPWWLDRSYAASMATLFEEPWLEQDHLAYDVLMSERKHIPPSHAFVAAGQSNMTLMMRSKRLPPALAQALPDEPWFMVTSARSATPLRMWERGERMYDVLLDGWYAESLGRDVKSVTLIWSQGGADIKADTVSTYAKRFEAFVDNLEQDLGHPPNVVVARLTDATAKKIRRDELRGIQVELGTGPHRAWVDLDDLNLDPAAEVGKKRVDDVHIPAKNLELFARRLAFQAVRLALGEEPAADGRPPTGLSPQ